MSWHLRGRRRAAGIGRLDVIEARVFGAEITSGEERSQTWNRRSDDRAVFGIDDAKEVHGHGLGLVLALHGGELSRLLVGNDLGLHVRDRHHEHHAHERDDGAPAHHLGDELGVTTLEMVVRGNRHGDERTEHEKRENRVQIRGHGLRIECRGKEVRDDRLATMRRLDDLVTRGRLHPRIGDENPQRRKHRAEPHEPAGNHVELGRHAFTAKEEHAQEARLQEEGEPMPRRQAASRRCRPRSASNRPSWCRS